MSHRVPSEPPSDVGWQLRGYQPGDEAALLAGFEQVYGWQMPETTWRWKLKTREALTENIWVVVDRQGQPIFHYAGIPCRLRLPSGIFDALVAVDLWTLPEYRRQGLFTRCAGWIHEHWRQAGYVGLLGAPNEQFGSRDRYLGWRPLFPLRWQIRPLRPEAIIARRLGVPGLSRARGISRLWNQWWDRGAKSSPLECEILNLSQGETFAADDRLPKSAAPWGVERGTDWVRWRYQTCPRFDYSVLVARCQHRACGYLAYRVEDLPDRRFGFIAEMVAEGDDPGIIETLIIAGVERLAAEGVDAIATLAIPSTDHYRRWRRHGFLFSWGSFGVQCLPFSESMDPKTLRDPGQWSLMGGDFDVI